MTKLSHRGDTLCGWSRKRRAVQNRKSSQAFQPVRRKSVRMHFSFVSTLQQREWKGREGKIRGGEEEEEVK